MPKIALISAGSLVFTRALSSDILLTPALRHDACISLMDIDPHRLTAELLAAQARWLPQFRL